jgi:hypothetical protein
MKKEEHCFVSNIRRRICILFLTCFVIVISSFEGIAGTLIVNHTAVDAYSQIPPYWIDQVKKMWVTVPGESHSSGYRIGLNLLESADSIFQVTIQESGTPEGPTNAYLRFSRATRGSVAGTNTWVYSYGEEDWYTSQTAIDNTKAGITYCNTNGFIISAMGFGWCWDMTWHNGVGGTEDPVYRVKWAGSSVGGPDGDLRWGLDAEDSVLTGNHVCMDNYLQATQEYVDYCKTLGYPTKIFFTTGPIDGTSGELAYQRYLKHKHIRNYVAASDSGILFDYADILSWSNSGVENTQSWTDYGGTPHTFQYIHSDNMLDLDGSYVEDGDHIGQRGALRLGKAMWYLLARLAGWDGNPSTVHDGSNMPQQSALYQNYPNPFNPTTTIEFQIPPSPFSEKGERGGFVSLKIFDLLGREVATLVNEKKPAGSHQVQWNAGNIPSGVYFYRLSAGSFIETKKLLLLK